MRKFYIAGLVIAIALIAGIVLADQMTFSTYYPAPFGVYNQMVVRTLGVGDSNDDGSINYLDAPDPNNEEQKNDLWVAGNVGIGTTEPKAGLHVESASGTIILHDPAVLDSMWRLDQMSSDGTLRILATDINDGNPKNVLVLDAATGNVGIGTTAPDAPLHIRSNRTPELYLEETGETKSAQIYFKNPTRTWQVGGDASPDIFFIHQVGQPQDDFVIDSNGNVGIGVIAPTSEESPGNNEATGNLDVNDVWLRGADGGDGAWASEGGGGINIRF